LTASLQPQRHDSRRVAVRRRPPSGVCPAAFTASPPAPSSDRPERRTGSADRKQGPAASTYRQLEHILLGSNRSEQDVLKLLNLERFLTDWMIPSNRKAR
jgi:hypothetical protein